MAPSPLCEAEEGKVSVTQFPALPDPVVNEEAILRRDVF